MGTLKVTVCEGYNLLQTDAEEYLGTCVILSGGLTTEKTTIKKKEFGHALWNETLNVRTQKGTKHMNISITVWDIYGDREICIGYSIFPPKPSMDGSILTAYLSPRPGRNDNAQGKVMYRIVPGGSKIKVKFEKSDEKQVKSRVQAANSKRSTELDLTGCNLKNIPTIVTENTHWTYLDISFNYVCTWPDSLTVLRESLKELLISSNGITEIGASIGELTNLNSIYLNGNCIRSLPPEIENLTSLSVLSLDNNALESIPPQICSLKSLQVLKLCYNPIYKLPAEIGKCIFLTHIDMAGSLLESLPEEFYRLRSLVNINFSFNKLTELSESISNLTTLSVINLSHNKLTDLPRAIGACPVEVLLIDSNPLKNDQLIEASVNTHKLRVYLKKRYEELLKEQETASKRVVPSSNAAESPTEEPVTIYSSDYVSNDEIVADLSNWVTIFTQYLDEAKKAISDEQSVADTTQNQSWKQLCHYGQRLYSIIKKRLAQIKKNIMLAKSIENLARMSPSLERLDHMVNDFLFHFPSQYKLHSVQLFQHETNLQQQKKLHIFTLKELDVAFMSVLGAVTQKPPSKDMNIILDFIKDVLAELVVIPVKDTSEND